MKADIKFQNKDPEFWAYVKMISEKGSYSQNGKIKTYQSCIEIKNILDTNQTNYNDTIITEVFQYLNLRAKLLNDEVDKNLRDIDAAKIMFDNYHQLYKTQGLKCKLPNNKQKDSKSGFAYYTGTINIITEMTIRKFAEEKGLCYGKDIDFDEDPRSLTYIKNDNDFLLAVLSRRFDGAFPGTINPLAIWEIKEYYNTTTFGSRIADGVYETQLDGYELQEIQKVCGFRPRHIYFIDSRRTWWEKGKSYLCRIIDMLHQGLVDDVFFGGEIEIGWPICLLEILNNRYSV